MGVNDAREQLEVAIEQYNLLEREHEALKVKHAALLAQPSYSDGFVEGRELGKDVTRSALRILENVRSILRLTGVTAPAKLKLLRQATSASAALDLLKEEQDAGNR